MCSALPPEDRGRSPYTGWTRTHWTALADRMLTAVDPYRSPGYAFVDLPAPTSGNRRPDGPGGLEGLARTFIFAGFRVAGERGADPSGLLERYARGLATGTDPHAAERWPRPRGSAEPGSRVRVAAAAATIAFALQLTRPWLWDRLDDQVRERTADWLTAAVAAPYPQAGREWLLMVTESFLHQATGHPPAQRVRENLAAHGSPPRSGGRFGKGRDRAYEHGTEWAPHLHPLLWAHLFDTTGALCPPALRRRWQRNLSARLDDAVRLISTDGTPLLQGQGLTDPLAAAAPLWIGALTGTGGLAPGLVRRAASGMLRHVTTLGTLGPGGPNGALPRGRSRGWTDLRHPEPGSPYRAATGMLGLLLPADHPVWTEPEQPLPIEEGDTARVIAAPGWLVSARRADGITLVLNHGTDQPGPGDIHADDPRYSRLGYSTATAPRPAGPMWQGPIDNSVAVLDHAGQATHRGGFRTLFAQELPGATLVAASRGLVHWIHRTYQVYDAGGIAFSGGFRPGPDGAAGDRMRGRRLTVTPGPQVTVASAVRAGVEVRLVRLDLPPGSAADPAAAWRAVRLGGWPVGATTPPLVRDRLAPGPTAEAATARLRSRVHSLRGFDQGGVATGDGTNSRTRWTATPWLAATGPAPIGEVLAAVVTLDRSVGPRSDPTLSVQAAPGGAHRVTVVWPDGGMTVLTVPGPD
ncbi:DUF2264 domain-containing protein [Actinacidiphila sp. ITFR-21]|uniref:DUF2264 domain-containing protein n=1 Tax=Actinacidiphila sp. ITFR-21 TaxID=3075199 RepID=UPI0028891FB4|nr:DUF2264 domain-containing protein [Streptomyces sp. ITFR-21]WNI14269.1 DUF2264 domain-containing protein [Streptomyces sp. ITFR-21]